MKLFIPTIKSETVLLLLLVLAIVCHGTVRIEPPLGWINDSNGDSTNFRFVSPKSSIDFFANLIVARAHAAGPELNANTPEKIKDYIVHTHQTVFSSYQIINAATREISKVKGAYVVFSYVYDKRPLTGYQFAFRLKGDLVSIVYTCENSESSKLKSSIEKSLKTLWLVGETQETK